ncbi:MAG: gluconokinase [Coleofasciculus sp. A1-SPW-01]|uniref:gluconokinase n=1 Tax=Coleofasciculus sp. A1-SPW-01 TaxID=3070819 RepID=UPI0032F9A0C3
MIIIVMGVSGSGKSRVGQALAQRLGWQFRDADDFHPQAAKEKMKQAIPLNDQDRQPWLEAMQSAIDRWIMAGKNTVLACSALKSSYRQVLQIQDSQAPSASRRAMARLYIASPAPPAPSAL